MLVNIKLNTAGASSGPFDLYTDADGFNTPFLSGVDKATLLTGLNYDVPNVATKLKIVSQGECQDYPLLLEILEPE